MLDGDEAIAGLMAKHLGEGRSFPVFFYGQRFSLSIVEAAAGAVAFRFLGASSSALQWSELALWSIGLVVLAAAARELARPAVGAVTAILLAVAPGWYVWSHKARPGYVTAFVATGVALWLVARGRRTGRWSVRVLAAVGVCTAVVGAAFSPGLVVLLPFFGFLDHRAGRTRAAAWIAVGGSGVALALAVASADAGDPYWAPSVFGVPDSLATVSWLRWRVSVALGGGYHMAQRLDGGSWVRFAGIAWSTVAIVLALHGLWRGARERRWTPSVATAIATASVFLYAIFVAHFSFRYLLPLATLAVLLVALAWGEALARSRRVRALATAAVAALAVLSLAADVGLSRLSFSGMPPPALPAEAGREHDDVRRLLAELDRRGVRHVYSLDHLLQWTLQFESGERILARWTQPIDRRPEVPRAVDAALHAGRPTALIGYAQQQPRIAAAVSGAGGDDAAAGGDIGEIVAGRFVVFASPDEALLARAGFTLNPR
jgi:hypothetical protein